NLARALDRGVHGREWLFYRVPPTRGAPLDGLGAFLQAPGTTADCLLATLGHAFCVTLLEGTRRTRLARMGGALAAAALLGGELLGRLGGLGRGWRRRGLGSGLLGLHLVGCLRLDLGVLGLLVVCLVCHLYPFGLSAQLVWFSVRSSVARSAAKLRSWATVSARASSRRERRTPAVSSSSPVAFAKRLPNRSLRRVVICSASSSGSISLISLAFMARSSPLARRTWI